MNEKDSSKPKPQAGGESEEADKIPKNLEDIIDPAGEKKILRKIDANLITLFGALYLMSFLGEHS